MGKPKAQQPGEPEKAVPPTRPENEAIQAASEMERKRIYSQNGRMGTMLTAPQVPMMKQRTGD